MTRTSIAVAVGGVAFAAASPKVGLHLLAWVAIVPLLLAVRGSSARRAWWLGTLFGLAWRGGTLYWVVYAMTRFGGLPLPVAILAAAGLVGYMALYTSVFALLARSRSPGIWGPLGVAAVWTGLELVQAHLFSGFPWVLAGYAAGGTSILAQGADLAGVYGLSFAVVAVNAALADLLSRGRGAVRSVLPVCLLIAVLLGYGMVRLAMAPDAPESDDGLAVALVQGNVSQDRKWDPAARDEILADHLALTARALRRGAKLVIWPESSWPDAYGVERDPTARGRLESLARASDAAILVGTVRVHDAGPELEVGNAAVLFDADGSVAGHYEKVHLVPFGEYLPLRDLLDFLGPLVRAVGELRAGAPDQPLLAAPRAGVPPFATAICYEIVFPSLVGDQVRRGATFLVTITNDAWYGTTSAPYQHFAMARLRAIENRRWLVRAANTGISGIVDPWGRVRQRTQLFRQAVVRGRVVPRDGLTPYARFGDLFAFLCLAYAVAAGIVAWRERRDTDGGGITYHSRRE